MTCIHRGKKLALLGTKSDPVIVYQCQHIQGPCVATAAMLDQMPGSIATSCEDCPFFAAAVSESEAAFRGLAWGQGESRSGPGSSLDATLALRRQLPIVLWALESRSITMLDIPCGDHHWMERMIERHTRPPHDDDGNPIDFDLHFASSRMGYVEYIGADVVREIVEHNREKWPGRDFRHLDITADQLPKCDVIFCRDCLVHLPYRMIRQALARIVESGATWLITTHFPGRSNHDIEIGAWRPLDLTAAPFYLPRPGGVVNEECKEGNGAYADKSLGTWLIDDIREAVRRMNAGPRLTIGLPYFRDWPGLWATVESLLLHHSDAMRDVELIVVDNDLQGDPSAVSESNHSWKARSLCQQVCGRYEHFTSVAGTAAAKGRVFELASAPSVLVMDCHVLLPTGVLAKLIEWFSDNAESKDLIQGPMIAAGDSVLATHFEPRWGSLMFGQWGLDHEKLRAGEPFEIPAMGCGLFAMNKEAWPRFHELLRGFGPEEFHLHNRVRRDGGRCLCLPWLKWSHRFGNPNGHKVPGLSAKERLRGHLITAMDTGEPTIESVRHHFVEETKSVSDSEFDAVVKFVDAEFKQNREFPPILVQGWNFARAVSKWVAAGRPVASQEVIKQRAATCKLCPNLIDNACKLCGCPIGGHGKLLSKLSMATESCYADPPKWGPVTDSQQSEPAKSDIR